MNVFEKIFPIEGYVVEQKGNLPKGYTKALTHLYQPLIGLTAVMLYQTLLHEMELQQGDKPQTHHTLMNYMNLPLDEIYQARLKLEGIGLLKTFKHQTDPNDYYTYVLLEPFAPGDFFKDDMLTQLLYHHLGEDKFAMLKNHYSVHSREESGNEITAAFQEVFQTFQPQDPPVEAVDIPVPEQERTIDFTWMRQMLRQRMIPEESVLTLENRKLISQMMVLYDLAEHEVEKAVMWALTAENSLDPDEFKGACHDLFHSSHQESVVKLTDRLTEQKRRQPTVKPATKEEQLIYELETISPKQLLEDLSSGNHASGQDLKIIRDVMTTQGLPAPVMNVLIHYVLLQSNMKLSKAYLETIASHWSRANLQTAKEAMEFAKKEKAKYQKGSPKKQNYRRPVSNEVVPDWFKERKKKQAKANAGANYTETEEEKAEFDALLREFTSKK
ncbi:DnaD domain protein [Lentibacillus sp. N15]|uniref:replication initiation and membrane attachment family protein n=1 Tax=Lentibacillus songyuanensis TaxID=3136161 RepID=UPI0031BAC406